MEPGTTADRTARFLFAALTFVVLVLTHPPWRFSVPEAGVDPSWQVVVTHAAVSGWQWGRDIVFTYGPLGFAVPNLWSDRAGTALVINGFLLFAAALAVLGLVRDRGSREVWVLSLVALLPMGLASRYGIYTALPLLAALRHFGRPADPLRFDAAVLAVATALFALVYVASGVPAVAIFALIDASRVRHRRAPAMVPLFLVAAVSWWLLAGQPFATLGLFVRSTFEQVAGYADAVAVSGPRLELLAYLGGSLVAFGLVATTERHRIRDPRQRFDASLFLVALAAFWFVSFKRGFVRHDLHSLSAWFALAIGTGTYAVARWGTIDSRGLGGALIALSFGAAVAGILVQEATDPVVSVARALDQVFVVRTRSALRELAGAVRDPDRWRSEWDERVSAANERLRASAPVPNVDGTVDIVAAMQSSVLAQGLDYRPRPVFHDYAAVTPWLIDLNRAYYRSERAPRYVLYRPETLDDRYPLLDQGPLWLDLLARYDPRRIDGEFLVLARRSEPLAVVETDAHSLAVELGRWVPLGPRDPPQILRAEIAWNVAGKALGLALKPPVLVIGVRLANGAEREYRLVPAMATAGFLLSPLVENSIELAAVATQAPDAPDAGAILAGKKVVALRIDTESAFGRRFVESPIRVVIASLQTEDRAPTADVRRSLRRGRIAAEMAARSSIGPPRVEVRGTEVFAHAPASIALPLAAASRLRASFGIHEGAFSGDGATDGVCFRVAAIDRGGNRMPLAERCLDPRTRREDRAVQALDVPLGLVGGALVFETECRASCDWDWSYWKDIEIDP